MCKFCKSEDEMYPDLGEGAFLEINTKATWITGDHEQGIRIAQNREVVYAGPEGTEKRDEVQCVYIAWKDVHSLILGLIAADMKHKVEEDDES